MNQLADPEILAPNSSSADDHPRESPRVVPSHVQELGRAASAVGPEVLVPRGLRALSEVTYHSKDSPSPELSFALNARTVVGVAAPSACKAIGDYWAFAQIAAGGMATVHVGYGLHNGKRRTVAIKLLKHAYVEDDEFVAMFTSEARLAARIQHPNVVQTLDFVREDSELALVMDYIPGEALSKLLVAGYRDGNPATPPILRRILADVLRGLHAAHEARDADGKKAYVVHRDVSPQNILVGVDGVARVLDFGIAQAAGRVSFTRDNEVRGKLSYVAPEQLEDGPVDLRADIYSASVVLWEALTCKRLFQTDDEATTLSRVLNLRVPPPSYYNKGVTTDLDSVVLKGLNRNRQLRYQSAWDMARAVAASGPCATRDEVADWVNAVATQKLAERQRLVAAMHGAAIDQPSEYPAHRVDAATNGAFGNPMTTSGPTSERHLLSAGDPDFGQGPFSSSEPNGPENSFADLPMVSDAHLLPSPSLRMRRRVNNALLAAATLFGGAVLGTTLVLQGANFLEPTEQPQTFARFQLGGRSEHGARPNETTSVQPDALLTAAVRQSGIANPTIPRPENELASDTLARDSEKGEKPAEGSPDRVAVLGPAKSALLPPGVRQSSGGAELELERPATGDQLIQAREAQLQSSTQRRAGESKAVGSNVGDSDAQPSKAVPNTSNLGGSTSVGSPKTAVDAAPSTKPALAPAAKGLGNGAQCRSSVRAKTRSYWHG